MMPQEHAALQQHSPASQYAETTAGKQSAPMNVPSEQQHQVPFDSHAGTIRYDAEPAYPYDSLSGRCKPNVHLALPCICKCRQLGALFLPPASRLCAVGLLLTLLSGV